MPRQRSRLAGVGLSAIIYFFCLPPAGVAQEHAPQVQGTTPAATPTRSSYTTTTQTFLEVYDLIRNKFVSEVTPERLLTAAVARMLADVPSVPSATELLQWDDEALREPRAELNRFTSVLRTVRRQYRPEASLSSLLEDAVVGMVDCLKDPYSRYLPPEEHEELAEYISGERGRYVGVGIHIGLDNGVVTVVRPIEGSPAYERGLVAGDRIVAVDGVDVRGTEVLEDVVNRIKGPEGTTVVLTVERAGVPEPIQFDVVRRAVTPRNIDYQMVGSKVGWLRLYTFSQNAVREVKDALYVLEMSGAQVLVLDLRQDPGGLLEAAVGVSDLFLPPGCLIVEVKGRDELMYRRETAAFPAVWSRPVVLLVDGASASASEIVTGALKDNGRAMVVGETTFGKGSVQQVFELSQGGSGPALRLSTALYYTPSGVCINKIGIDPDIEVPRARPDAEPRDVTEEATLGSQPTPTPDPLWWVRRDNQLVAAIAQAEQLLAAR